MSVSFGQKEEEDIAPGDKVVAESWVEWGVQYTSTDLVTNTIPFDSEEEVVLHQHFFGGTLVHRQVYALAWQPGSPPGISADDEE